MRNAPLIQLAEVVSVGRTKTHRSLEAFFHSAHFTGANHSGNWLRRPFT